MKKYTNQIRAANLILDALIRLRKNKYESMCRQLESFKGKYGEIVGNCNRLGTSVGNDFLMTAEKLKTAIERDIIEFSHCLENLKRTLKANDTKIPVLREILESLLQLEDEFENVHIDIKTRTISVITGNIEFEEIPLGNFQIRLCIDMIEKLYDVSPYDIFALKPNPASANSSIVHPHVSDGKLCEGDGMVTIRKAIEQGRVFDFFTIVENILNTYNPDSPYISLDDWDGIACHDCGYTISSNYNNYCEFCGCDYCDECSTCCDDCNMTVCFDCSYECNDCQRRVCKTCTDICVECGESYCTDCLNEYGICSECHDNRKEQENENPTETISEVQPDGMGQARISA